MYLMNKRKKEKHKCSFSCRDSLACAPVALPARVCVYVCVCVFGGSLLAFTFSGVQQVQRAVRC